MSTFSRPTARSSDHALLDDTLHVQRVGPEFLVAEGIERKICWPLASVCGDMSSTTSNPPVRRGCRVIQPATRRSLSNRRVQLGRRSMKHDGSSVSPVTPRKPCHVAFLVRVVLRINCVLLSSGRAPRRFSGGTLTGPQETARDPSFWWTEG